MKKLIAMALGVAMILSLSACSLFDSGSTGGADAELFEVKISDTFTHEDPVDIEFADRYTLYDGGNTELAQWYKEECGVDLVNEFMIFYADKDDTMVRQYLYLVFATEEDAKAFQEYEEEYNEETVVEGTVVYQVMEREEVETDIEAYISMNVLEDAKASTYVQANKEQFDELIPYTGK